MRGGLDARSAARTAGAGRSPCPVVGAPAVPLSAVPSDVSQPGPEQGTSQGLSRSDAAAVEHGSLGESGADETVVGTIDAANAPSRATARKAGRVEVAAWHFLGPGAGVGA